MASRMIKKELLAAEKKVAGLKDFIKIGFLFADEKDKESKSYMKNEVIIFCENMKHIDVVLQRQLVNAQKEVTDIKLKLINQINKELLEEQQRVNERSNRVDKWMRAEKKFLSDRWKLMNYNNVCLCNNACKDPIICPQIFIHLTEESCRNKRTLANKTQDGL